MCHTGISISWTEIEEIKDNSGLSSGRNKERFEATIFLMEVESEEVVLCRRAACFVGCSVSFLSLLSSSYTS